MSSLPPASDETAPPKRAVLLVNTKSRRGKEWFADAKEGLAKRGVELEAAYSFRTLGELLGEAQAAIQRKVPLVVAGGGDGTFSAIARYFVETRTILGVLPLGTGNAFARDLGIPADVDRACDIVATGRVDSVDLGHAADDYFVNLATVGLTTYIAQNLTVPLKRKFGRFVYAIALTRALSHVKPFQATLTTENGEVGFDTLQIVIGNGRFHAGPFPLSPHASITDRRLSVYAVKSRSKATFFKMALWLPSGRHVGMDEIHYEDCRSGILRTFPHMPVTVDGEVCAQTPLDFSVAPKALRVVVPADQNPTS
ncbi:MAG TPA: YegS/Rv2252/BmrU family lipid kinase [Fimbriimonas sp.]